MSEDTETGLPVSFETAWGVRDRPTKGPKRGLSLDQVVAAGIGVANADGIEGVSMSRVARALGTSAMSLYRYVASKDELLVLMIDGAFGLHEWRLADGTWRDRLASWAAIELAAYRRFPWVLRVPVNAAPIMPNQLRFLEHGLRAFSGTALAEPEKLSVILLVTSYVRSYAQLNADLREAYAAGDAVARATVHYGRLVTTLTSREEFPALHAVVDAGAFEDMTPDEGDNFQFGLDRILDGVEALMRSRE